MTNKQTSRHGDAIVVKNLQKAYKDLQVLRGITFGVPRGRILALLGPNGAGKTTTIKILSTLLQADGGKAVVNGYNVETESDGVRASIGLTGQYAAVDEYLTARENLQLIGRLYRLHRAEATRRADDLLKKVDLLSAGKRTVKTYSGGMRRRLDLAMSLIANPPIIFLDEPTTGLDPRSRMTMWVMIKKLAEEGTTILLTTQYMEEADQLADNVVVIDNGKVIAEGTPSELKSKVGSEQLEVTISRKSDFALAQAVLTGHKLKVNEEARTISLPTKNGVVTLRQVLQHLEEAKMKVDSVSLHRPTLDDVFLSLTGRGTAKIEQETETQKGAK